MGAWGVIAVVGLVVWAVLAYAGRSAFAWAARQWPAITALCLAVALSFATGWLRLNDNRSADVTAQDLDSASVGVFLGLDSAVALTPTALPGLDEDLDAPRLRWTFDVAIGEPNRATVSLVLFDAPELWRVDLDRPVDVVIQLPEGATLRRGEGTLIAGPGSEDACASWSDGNTSDYAETGAQTSSSGTTVVICHIPAVGQVSQLFFQIAFEWHDRLRSDVGFGRQESWLRVQDWLRPPSDVDIPRESYNGLAQPLDVRVRVASGQRVVDAFPSPEGGAFSERVWRLERGGDIQYTVESPRDRALVAPAIDLSLLLAGVFFGLVPALRRRPRTG